MRELIRLLHDAVRLDSFDVAYEFSSEKLNILSGKASALPRKGILTRLAIFFWHLVKSADSERSGGRTSIPERPVVFFALAKNEKEALQPVYSGVRDAFWLTRELRRGSGFSWFRAHLWALPFFPLLIPAFISASRYRRMSYAYVLDHYWFNYGLYVETRLWLRAVRPRALIVANDVSGFHRVMVRAARAESVVTFYIQHASVPDNFPPLEFDYAFLQGAIALKKHAKKGGEQATVFLLGMPKYDPHVTRMNNEASVRRIGVCTNGLDPLARADELFAALRRSAPDLSFLLRPHDADRRTHEWRALAEKYNLEFSDSRVEAPFDFLARVDAIIAGDSNIALEAALMNVVPLSYDFAQRRLDWYGFVRNGLVEYFSEPAELCQSIERLMSEKPEVRSRARPYCATIGTQYDGRSAELAAILIECLVGDSKQPCAAWRRIVDSTLVAYEPTDVGAERPIA